MPRFLPLSIVMVLAQQATAAQPPVAKIIVVHPQPDQQLTGCVEVRLKTELQEGASEPAAVYVGLGGAPWTELKQSSDEWMAKIDSTLGPSGNTKLIVLTDNQKLNTSIAVTVTNPLKVFFADLHSHTSYSDGALIPAVCETRQGSAGSSRVMSTKNWMLLGGGRIALAGLLAVAPPAVVPSVASAAAPSKKGLPPVTHVVIEASGPTMPRADTASIAELSDGRLMIVYQKYERGKHAGADEGFCRIWSKISPDHGHTWGDPRMLVDVAPGDLNVMDPMLLRLRSGDLLLACHRNHPPKSALGGGSKVSEALLRSNDDGKTFVEQTLIWRRPPSYRVAMPPFIQLCSGRILLPFSGRGGSRSKNFAAWCVLSDDNGKTWTESTGIIKLPKRGALEPCVVELADGTLLMSIRTQLGGPYLSRSTDGGQSWSEAKFSGLEGGESNTCLRRIPGTNDLLLLFNNSKYIPQGHHHYGERTPLTAAVSGDAGHRWRIVGNLASDPQAEYTNLNCFFTREGKAIVTYMFAKPAWNRERIDLRAALIDMSWFELPARAGLISEPDLEACGRCGSM